MNTQTIYEMVKKSVFFSGAGFAYSFFRQLVFLPILYRIDTSLFAQITITIILIDALQLSTAAMLSQYYGRLLHDKSNSIKILNRLKQLWWIAIMALPVIMYFSGLFIVDAMLVTLYMVIMMLNSLNLRFLYNELQFHEQYISNASRLFPYLVLTVAAYSGSTQLISIFLAALVLCESMHYKRTQSKVSGLSNPSEIEPDILLDKLDLMMFAAGCVLVSFAYRSDVILVNKYFPDDYVHYVSLVNIANFYITPILVFSGTALHSILSYFKIPQLSTSARIGVVFITLIVAIGMTFVAYLTFGYVYALVYGHPLRYSNNLELWVIFFTAMFVIPQSFASRFSSSKHIVFSYSAFYLVILLLIQLNLSLIAFVMIFFILRFTCAGFNLIHGRI